MQLLERSRPLAFTLIELLGVIAIIAITTRSSIKVKARQPRLVRANGNIRLRSFI